MLDVPDPIRSQVISANWIAATSPRLPRSSPAPCASSNSHKDWLQENRKAISERLELSFEQSRNGETYTYEQARQLLADHSSAATSE